MRVKTENNKQTKIYMKLRNLFLGVCSAAAIFAACEQVEENLGIPDISISENEMSFEAAGGNKELTVSATRDWKVETDAEWVVVSPETGAASLEPQPVTVTVLENTGMDRTADLKFTIGMKSKYLTVTQAGPGGSVTDLIIYSNDFDKEAATKEYGSSSTSWPYLDQFDGWMNHTGTGAAEVTYNFKAMSARNNSNSDGSYSDYPGSGVNNMFFGSGAYFAVNNIALNGAKNISLTFGTEKYSQDLGSVFTPSEFHIYLSNDGAKWVELTEYTFAGGTTEGRWNVASALFSVPEGTASLSLCFAADAASSYRLDDLKLEVAETAGTEVDFSKAVEKDFTAGGTGTGNNGGGTGGGSSDASAIYSNNFDKTISSKNSSGKWPFCDEFDGWKNEAGTGASNITYAFKSASSRASSENNNIWLPKTGAYFAVHNIALNNTTTLELSFNVICGSPGSYKKSFNASVFKVYLSADKTKWVELPVNITAHDKEFDDAVATFSVPANTAALSITFEKIEDESDGYRIDNISLKSSTTAGTAIDFTKGVEKDFEAGSTGGGNNGGTTPPSVGGSAMTIVEVLASSGVFASGTTVEGVVISNMALNNLTSKKGMYIQDETAGLQFYLGANHEFAFGDKVKVDLSGASLAEYNGAVQISGLALDKISKVSSGNTVTPKTVTMADFLANKYEGQYVALEGVQVAGSDLARTFVEGDAHTSINVEDANGNKFVVFSSKYATYGAQTVPQGSGVIKGISSISKGAMQIIFAQESDFAGLTGARFDSAGGNNGGETETPGDGGNTETPGGDSGNTETPGGGGYIETPEEEVTPGALVVVLSAAEKPCEDFPLVATKETTTKTYTIGEYEWTFSPTGGNKFGWHDTQRYILWGKQGGYILMPAIEGKKLTSVKILTGIGASKNVSVGVYDANGEEAVAGGEAIVLAEQAGEFSWTLTGTEVNTHYQFRITNAYNAQLQTLTLIYE